MFRLIFLSFGPLARYSKSYKDFYNGGDVVVLTSAAKDETSHTSKTLIYLFLSMCHFGYTEQ